MSREMTEKEVATLGRLFGNFFERLSSGDATYWVGVVGYSAQKFDVEEAKQIIKEEFDNIEKLYEGKPITVVSGLTAMGIPKIAYDEATRRGWKTMGIACSKANEFEKFPVDEEIIIGKEWGDESNTFLNHIDVLLKVGGGKQAERETQAAKDSGMQVIERFI